MLSDAMNTRFTKLHSPIKKEKMMPAKSFLKIPLLFVCLSIAAGGCYKQEGGELTIAPPPPDLLIQLYQPEAFSLDPDDPNYLQMSIRSEGLQFSSFGYFDADNLPVNPRSFYLADENQGEQIAVLLDDKGEPAFLYAVDPAVGTKSEALVEFEPIAPGEFYLRFYYYDWVNRIGTLLFETVIRRSGDDFLSTPTFETDNLALEGIIKSGRKPGNQSFGAPLARLEALSGSEAVTFRDGFLEDLEDKIDNFSTSDMIDFATSHLREVQVGGVAAALVGWGLSSSAVATASAAAPILIVAGGGIALAALVTEGVMKKDKIAQSIADIKNNFSQLGNRVLETANARIESLRGYKADLSDTWNRLTDNFPTLEDMLDYIREVELLVPDEELDDLPDSNGVVHVALSWNTGDTDIDLWVTDPSGERIYYENPRSASQGYLDRDDTDGFGPENIYWRDGAPDGRYQVQVHYFGCDGDVYGERCPSTTVTVTVSNGLGYVNTVTGTLNRVDDVLLIDVFDKVDKSIE